SNVKSKAGEILSTVTTKFSDAKDKITEPIRKAKDKIGEYVEAIKSFFSNLKLKIPTPSLPKLPQIKVSGKGTSAMPPMPKISWNAKGGIFRNPTIFNTANAGLQGVGEAGAEAILPLNNKTLSSIGEGIAKTMSSRDDKLLQATLEQNKLLMQLLRKDPNIIINKRDMVDVVNEENDLDGIGAIFD